MEEGYAILEYKRGYPFSIIILRSVAIGSTTHNYLVVNPFLFILTGEVKN